MATSKRLARRPPRRHSARAVCKRSSRPAVRHHMAAVSRAIPLPVRHRYRSPRFPHRAVSPASTPSCPAPSSALEPELRLFRRDRGSSMATRSILVSICGLVRLPGAASPEIRPSWAADHPPRPTAGSIPASRMTPSAALQLFDQGCSSLPTAAAAPPKARPQCSSFPATGWRFVVDANGDGRKIREQNWPTRYGDPPANIAARERPGASGPTL